MHRYHFSGPLVSNLTQSTHPKMVLGTEGLNRDAPELLVLEQDARQDIFRFYAMQDLLSTGITNRKWHFPQK